MDGLHYCISAEVWLYQGKGAWFFITLPKEASDEIRFLTHERRSAWGSVRVAAAIGGTKWSSSLFPDSTLGSYILPIKAEVRKREGIREGDTVTIDLDIAV